MHSDDRSLVMVFNGEIYNSTELRVYCESRGRRFRSRMDGEVILHLWQMEGEAGLRRLNGMFAVAIGDASTGEVVLFRDPVGVKPLFYAADASGGLWFASEVAGLSRMGAPVGQPDPVALAQFLTFLWIPDPRTPRIGVRSVLPGHLLRWSAGKMQLRPYGEPLTPAVGPAGTPRQQLLIEGRGRFLDAASRQLLSDVPIGLMASGGVDSGLLWWATRKGIDRAYTIAWTSHDDPEKLGEDTQAVSMLQRRLGTPTDYVAGEAAEDVVPPSGDLFADPAYGLTRLIARRAHDDGHKVLLSGQGGDELFGGYRRHATARLLALRTGSVGEALERQLKGLRSPRVGIEYLARLARASAERDPFCAYMHLCSYSTARERAEVLGCTEGEVSNEVVWQRHREVYENTPAGSSFLRRVMAVDLAVYLPGLGLAYADRGGMEFGVEIRVPWLDLELVRWSLTLPDEALIRWGRGKWLPKELARIALGKHLSHRPKRGFAAPASRVRQEQHHGTRAFRQGAYFARARRTLQAYLSEDAIASA